MDKYPNLSVILQIIFSISYSLDPVECGFDLNAALFVDNMTELLVVSRSMVKDYILRNDFKYVMC